MLLNGLLIVVAAKVWELPSIESLLEDTADAALDKIAKKYNVEVPRKEPSFLDTHDVSQINDLVSTIFPRSQALAAPSFQELFTNDDGSSEPSAFELDANAISKIFNESLKAAFEPLMRFAVLSEINSDGITFSDLKQARKIADCSLPEDIRLNVALNSLGLSLELRKLAERKEDIIRVVEAIDSQRSSFSGLYPFLEVQADVLPLFHSALPRIHLVSQRAVAALRELQPSRLNPVTVVPAMLELVTAGVSVQTTAERLLPLASLWLREGASAIRNLSSVVNNGEGGFLLPQTGGAGGVSLVSLEDGTVVEKPVGSVGAGGAGGSEGSPVEALEVVLGRVCASVAAMDPFYAGTMEAFHELIREVSALSPAVQQLVGRFLEVGPVIDEVGRVVFDLTEDLGGSLRRALAAFPRDGPVLVDFYENAEDFVPLLLSHFLRILRQGGVPQRTPILRQFMPEVQSFLTEMRTFAEDNEAKLRSLWDAVVRFAARIPRQLAATKAASNLLLHAAVVGHHTQMVLFPRLLELVEHGGLLLADVFAQCTNTSNCGTPNIAHTLNSVHQALDKIVTTLPAVSASIPLLAPLLHNAHQLTLTSLPTLKLLATSPNLPRLAPTLRALLDFADAIPPIVQL